MLNYNFLIVVFDNRCSNDFQIFLFKYNLENIMMQIAMKTVAEKWYKFKKFNSKRLRSAGAISKEKPVTFNIYLFDIVRYINTSNWELECDNSTENVFYFTADAHFDWSKQNVNTDGPLNDWFVYFYSMTSQISLS